MPLCETSIITSCQVRDSAQVIAELASYGIHHADLYCSDERNICQWYVGRRDRSAARAAARIADSLDGIDCKVTGAATYVTGLSSPAREARERAVGELAYLIDIFSILHEWDIAYPCIEIVGGAAFQVEVEALGPGEPRLAQLWVDRRPGTAERRLEALRKSLVRLARYIGERDVVLALEVEPGEGYLLHDLDNGVGRLVRLLKEGGGADHIFEQVTLNLDIGHMLLLEEIRERQELMDVLRELQGEGLRISHAHMSDHSRSHFVDLAPVTYHSLDAFEDWVGFFVDCCRDNERAKAFSFPGVLAVEMEACGSIHRAVYAYRLTEHLVEQELRRRGLPVA